MRTPAAILGFLASAASGWACAQGLPDPTRPPASLAADPAAAPRAVASPAGLQSIIRRHGAKPAAVINGTYVELGGRVGEARVERIGEDSVVLRSALGRETLYLTPAVGKKAAPGGTGAAGAPPGISEKATP